MNGVHDMGGMQCFGPVVEEKDEPVFHEAWERRAFGLTLAMGTSGLWNIDKARALREAMPPHKYLAWSYYQLWFEGLIGLLVDAGAIDAKELMEEGGPQTPKLPTRKLNPSNVEPMFMKGWPSHRHVAEPARFATGDRVTTVTDSMPSHTRLPRYCSGKQGTVIAVRGAHVFPDTNAKLAGEHPKWLYTVCFEAKDLFGATTTADAVNVDCFEPYLASAPEA